MKKAPTAVLPPELYHLDELFECLLELDTCIDDPVKLAMPFIMIVQIYGLFNEDSAGLLIGEFTPIQCKANFCFDFIFVLEQLLKDGFVIADVQFYRNCIAVFQSQNVQWYADEPRLNVIQ